MEYWRAFNSLQREFGGHPDIGLRLANLAADAGFCEIDLRSVAPHLDKRLSYAQRKEMADYFCEIFSSGAAGLLKRNRIAPELVAAMQADFAAIAADPESVMVYTAFQIRALR
jgi:hypothetical protein